MKMHDSARVPEDLLDKGLWDPADCQDKDQVEPSVDSAKVIQDLPHEEREPEVQEATAPPASPPMRSRRAALSHLTPSPNPNSSPNPNPSPSPSPSSSPVALTLTTTSFHHQIPLTH